MTSSAMASRLRSGGGEGADLAVDLVPQADKGQRFRDERAVLLGGA